MLTHEKNTLIYANNDYVNSYGIIKDFLFK